MRAIHIRTSRKTLVGTLLAASLALAAPGALGQPLPPPGSQEANDSAVSQWPLRIDTSNGQITIYQPQLTNFDGDKITARAAVSILRPGQTDPAFGAAWMESRVATDRVARTVQILDTVVTKAHFPDATGASEAELTAAVRSTLPGQPMTLSLDQLLAELQVIQKEKESVKAISTDPPKIIFQTHPTVLVQYDGGPRLSTVANSTLMRAVNTPFFVALDPNSRTYYLKGASRWFTAPDPMGPFQPTGNVPPEIAALADSSGYKDPQQGVTDAQAAGLEIITATDPTEVIWSDGPQQFAPIANTGLLYLANTDSDVFLQISTQNVFVLLSGRWYTAANQNGPWTFVPSDQLPADFKQIPPDSDKRDVLASVAGTQQAQDAIADTFVPQTAAIDRTNFEQPQVQYDGDPNFQPIENSSVSYAVNSPNSVLRVGGQYYCCANAVWYTSNSPTGPWDLCTSVPQDIYAIPPSCPDFPVRYVYVYETTPDVVYCGYLPGYVGCYRYDHAVIYGTGYHYQPWTGRVYYPRPITFGFASRYDAYSGHWGFNVGQVSNNDWLGDRSGHASWGSGWFGHGGYRPAYVHYDIDSHHVVNARPDYNGHDNGARNAGVQKTDINVYERRKDVRRDVVAHNGPIIAPPANRRTPPGEVRPGNVRPGNAHPGDARPGEARPAPTPANQNAQNNVMVDSSGNVYRKTDTGWEQRQGNKWVPRPTPGQPAPTPPAREKPAHDTPTHETPARQTPAHESPAPLTPAHETPGRETPARETPAHETPTPQTPAHETPAREAPARETPAQPPAHETPAQPPAHETPAHETPAREAPAQPPARETPAQPPAHETPAHETPAHATPAQPPAHETPAHEAPAREAPAQPPAHETPAHETPAREAPAQPPAHETPAHETPAREAPAQPPAHETPAHETPAQPPAREAPARQASPKEPAQSQSNDDLNKEYNARVAGEQRQKNAQPSPPPAAHGGGGSQNSGNANNGNNPQSGSQGGGQNSGGQNGGGQSGGGRGRH